MKLSQVQVELRPWQEHNFPGRPAWQPLLGIGEELGELNHSFLKREQQIRMNEDHDAKLRDALGDILIYMCDFANAEGLDLDAILAETWQEVVQKRDWRPVRVGGAALEGDEA
jgi:NTP pyrophosphatase (non-canonical NTP hydrolase)